MSNLKKNLSYQTAYQILTTCLPLITSPYLARVLGAEKQGVFSYTQSIINYFTLFAMLGVANYGTKVIASCKDNIEKRSIDFWNIYSLQFSASIVCTLIYLLYLLFICKENRIIAWLQGFYVLSAILDINWLFFGVERFEITVKRNMIIKVLSVIAILILVKSPDDLWIYTVIMAGGTLLTNLVLWFFIPSVINVKGIHDISLEKIKQHIKPNLVLFVPLLAMSVYHIMDKTMLGLFSTYEESGYYYNADKIINIPIGVINGIGTVMLPRATALISSGEQKKSDDLFNYSLEMVACLSAAMAFGIAAISKEFTPLFFGDGFTSCITLIIVLSPVLFVKGISQTARMQFLIPNEKENIFIESVIVGAVTNFIANIILISKLGALGAVVGTLSAELVSCIYQFIRMNKYINCKKTLVKSLIFIVFGLFLFISVRIIAVFIPNYAIGILIEICAGAVVYSMLCLVFFYFEKNPLLTHFISKRRKNNE